MLRPKIRQEIAAALDRNGRLLADEFTVDVTKRRDGGGLLTIGYRFNDKVRFTAVLPAGPKTVSRWGTDTYDIAITVIPGNMMQQESFVVATEELLMDAIDTWARRVYTELTTAPVLRELAEHRERIDQMIASMGSIPDTLFSREEAERFKKDLDALKESIAESLRQSESDQAELKKRIAEMESDIQTLKATLTTQSKRSWAGQFRIRFAKWTRDEDNKQLLNTATDVVRRLLGPGAE